MPDKKILYHGTGKTIGEFNRHTYFATDPKISDRYATYRRGEAPQMYRVEAKLKNPAYMDDFRKSKQELGEDAINEDVFSHLESKGFDHFLPYGKNSKEIVIFDPNKSTLPKFEDGGKVDNDGITAYHGSPHDFEQFDVSKIGSGEGAQAFGHGLYFAQSEPVAREYRDNLSSGKYKIDDGKTFDPGELEHRYLRPLARVDLDYAINEAKDLLNSQPENADMIKRDLEKLQTIKNKNATPFKGHMYEVHIQANPDHFLDWNKPLKNQHPVVQNAIQSLPYGNESVIEKSHNVMFGLEDARSAWMQRSGMDTRGNQDHRRAVSEDLAKAGLPGIKYLDLNSRVPPPAMDPDHIKRQIERNRKAAEKAQSEDHRADLDDDHRILLARLKKAEQNQTRNYVVFDHNLVNIKRKYAKGGLVK